MPRIAVVTGSNKGIGYAIVKLLAKQFDGDVYLTARDLSRGEEAVKSLKEKEGIDVKFHQLDINDEESCKTFVKDMKNLGGIDVLVNNAGIAFTTEATEPFGVQAATTMKTNYFSTSRFCQIAFPILNAHARVVHLSSLLGHLSILKGKEPEASVLRAKLADPEITQADLDALAQDFVKKAEAGTHLEAGWIGAAYSMSKIFLSVLGRIQQREMDKQRGSDDIVINCVHPGYVDTDMTGHQGPLTPERGAMSAVHCALLPNDVKEPRGGYVWHDCSIVDFTAESYPSQ